MEFGTLILFMTVPSGEGNSHLTSFSDFCLTELRPHSFDVPATDSLCVIVPDSHFGTNELDLFYHCWHKFGELTAPGVAWVFTYNALFHFHVPIGKTFQLS